MKTVISQQKALDIYGKLEDKLREKYPDLTVIHRTVSDKDSGGSFVIDADGKRSIILDLRPLSLGGEDGMIDVEIFMNVVVEYFHERAHLEQFSRTFRKGDPRSRKIALATLFGRYFPEYRQRINGSNPAELDAEKSALGKAHDLFIAMFERDGFDESRRDFGERPVDELMCEAMRKWSPWLQDEGFKTVQQALGILEDKISKDNSTYRPDLACVNTRVKHPLFPWLPGRESRMRKDIKADSGLYAKFTRLFDQGGNRATQWALMEQYVRVHPSKDLKLFPNLTYLVPDGVDLNKLLTLDKINDRLKDYNSGMRRMPDVSGIDLSEDDCARILTEFSQAGQKRIYGDKSLLGSDGMIGPQRGSMIGLDVKKSGKDGFEYKP